MKHISMVALLLSALTTCASEQATPATTEVVAQEQRTPEKVQLRGTQIALTYQRSRLPEAPVQREVHSQVITADSDVETSTLRYQILATNSGYKLNGPAALGGLMAGTAASFAHWLTLRGNMWTAQRTMNSVLQTIIHAQDMNAENMETIKKQLLSHRRALEKQSSFSVVRRSFPARAAVFMVPTVVAYNVINQIPHLKAALTHGINDAAWRVQSGTKGFFNGIKSAPLGIADYVAGCDAKLQSLADKLSDSEQK